MVGHSAGPAGPGAEAQTVNPLFIRGTERGQEGQVLGLEAEG